MPARTSEQPHTTETTASSRSRDLIVVPEARPPRRRGPIVALVAAALVIPIAAAAAGYRIAEDRGERRTEDAVAIARVEAEARAIEPVTAARQEVAGLETKVGELQARLAGSQERYDLLLGARRGSRDRLREARADLDDARADLRTFLGPPVAEGTHVVRVVAAGPAQSPPRLVAEVGRWFTGGDAHRAAIADGAIEAGESLPRNRYFRTGDRWSTLMVAPSVTVTVRRWTGTEGERTVTFARFARILRSDAPWARRAAHDPFRISLADGRVTSLEQQRYP